MIQFSIIKEEVYSIYDDYKGYGIFTDNRIEINEEKNGKKIISWPNYKSGIIKKEYLHIYRNIISERQYSYQFKDNSILQFYYDFSEDNILEKARLAYYPLPKFTCEISDEELLEHFIEFDYSYNDASYIIENGGFLTNTSHIRIDYDKNVTSHDKCEIQIDGLHEIRIPCSILINPLYFFEFILKCKAIVDNEYYKAYEKLQKDAGFIAKKKLSQKKHLRMENFSDSNIYITILEEE